MNLGYEVCEFSSIRYLGGKYKIAHEIAAILNRIECSSYVEPFCGALWIAQLVKHRPIYLSDACEPLITMHKALQAGWEPPDVVTEEDYARVKAAMDVNDPLTAFVGFGCSFSGKWFGGYARNEKIRNYADGAKRSLAEKFRQLNGDFAGAAKRSLAEKFTFTCADYESLPIGSGALVYCDPPYAGSTGYGGAKPWDAAAFWQWARITSRNAKVLVSEYAAPDDFECVAEFPTRTSLRDRGGFVIPRVERLFALRGTAHREPSLFDLN